jgi:hypothetical protein
MYYISIKCTITVIQTAVSLALCLKRDRLKLGVPGFVP